MELIKRTAATDKTVAAYADARFAWGRQDCVRMAALHIRNMGHKVSLVKAGEYRSETGAKRALERMGFETVEAALDVRFDRIAPASAWVGDIIALPSDGPFPALAIRLPNGRILHSFSSGFTISEPLHFTAAWRVPFLGK
jgi:hypothetical protein